MFQFQQFASLAVAFASDERLPFAESARQPVAGLQRLDRPRHRVQRFHRVKRFVWRRFAGDVLPGPGEQFQVGGVGQVDSRASSVQRFGRVDSLTYRVDRVTISFPDAVGFATKFRGPFGIGLGPFRIGLGPFGIGLGPFRIGLGPFRIGFGIVPLLKAVEFPRPIADRTDRVGKPTELFLQPLGVADEFPERATVGRRLA